MMESTGLCQTGVAGFPPSAKWRRKDRFICNNHSFVHCKLILDTFIEVDELDRSILVSTACAPIQGRYTTHTDPFIMGLYQKSLC